MKMASENLGEIKVAAAVVDTTNMAVPPLPMVEVEVAEAMIVEVVVVMVLKEAAEVATMAEVAGVRNLEATKSQAVAIEEAVSLLGKAVVAEIINKIEHHKI